MAKKSKKRKSSSSSKENYSDNSQSSESSKKSDDEKSDEDKSEKKIPSAEKQKILSARKLLHGMVLNYDAKKEGMPFSDYLSKKRKEEDGIDQIALEAKLDSSSIKSLTNYLEDNSFSKISSDNENEDDEYSPESSEPKAKKGEAKKTRNRKKGKKRGRKKGSTNKNKTQNNKKSKNSGKLLDGKVVSFTGSMIISKEGLKQILVNLGAKITSTVTSNTNILIHGDYLEDGRSYDLGKKYKVAKQKKIDIYSDREFEQYMEELTKTKWRMKDEVEKLGV